MQIGISSWEGLWAEFTGADKNLRILCEWAPTYRKLSWLTTLQKFNIDDEVFALKLADKYIAYRRDLHVIYRDTVPALEAFRSHYRLGILTNGAPDLQRRKIEGAGLGKYFKTIVVSGEIGIGKPDVRVFRTALSQLNVEPESALMVGDSLKSDIQGAQAVGMKTAWINRSRMVADIPIVPDLMVNNLDELREALERKII